MARIINEHQGTAGWHEHRAAHYNASDAPAAMGVSPYKTRSQLLTELKTGYKPPVDKNKQALFDRGHKVEAMARPWAEEIIGEDLYPVVLADEVGGLPLSASFDGLTMDQDTAFEHKLLNQELAANLDTGDTLAKHYRIQMEQQLLIADSECCLFMASNGDKETMRYRWYYHDPELLRELLASWHQFDKDLQGHEVPQAEAKPEGKDPVELPTLQFQLSASVIHSNMDEFRDQALAVFGSVNTDLQTDEDFADAEQTVKDCKTIEKRLDEQKEKALSSTSDIKDLFDTMDDVKEHARQTRLALEKQIKALKDERKKEIQNKAELAFNDHVEEAEQQLFDQCGWKITLPVDNPQIGQAMKNKRTLSSLQDAADTALARAKVDADAVRREVKEKIDILKELTHGYETLFPDAGDLVAHRSPDDLRQLALDRIAKHEENERQKAEQERRRQERQDAFEERAARAHTTHTTPETENNPEPSAAEKSEAARYDMQRPSDKQIITAVAEAFGVEYPIARGWLLSVAYKIQP